MFPKAGIKYSVDNNNVKFKIPLTDENWKGVYNKYQEDMNNNPETRTVDLKIPFTIYAGNQAQADAYQNKEIVGTGDFTFNTNFLGATTYMADKSVISLADLFSTCFPKKAEKANATFNHGNQAEFVDGDKNPKVIEIEKGQALTNDQLPKVKAKEGYVFNGWSILDNAGGLTGVFNNTNPINDNLNLIANCSPKTPIQTKEINETLKLEADILIGNETEHTKVFETTKDAKQLFTGLLSVKPIKDTLNKIELAFPGIQAQNISVKDCEFLMTSTLEIPQEMDFDPANVTAVLEGANGNFKIKDTKVQGRKVTVTLTTANENITAFTEIQKALANTDDNLKVTLSGVKFNNSSKANTNYTVKGSVGGHFTAQATHNLTGNTIKFNLTFKGEQNQAGQDFILASNLTTKTFNLL